VPNNYSNDLPSFAAWANKYFAFNGNARHPIQIKISFLRFEYPVVIVGDLSLLHSESPIQIASVLYFPKEPAFVLAQIVNDVLIFVVAILTVIRNQLF